MIQPDQARKRYRLRPFRLAMVLLAMVCLTYLVFLAPRRLAVALSMPAASVLNIRGAATYGAGAEAAYTGRCLALQVHPNGSLSAVIAVPAQATLVRLDPDGSVEQIVLDVPGKAQRAAFFADSSLAVWSHDGDQAAGSLSGFTRLPEALPPQGSLRPSWSRLLDLVSVALEPVGEGLLIIGAGGDLVPNVLTLLNSQGREIYTDLLADGLYTAWGRAQLSGGFAVGGATYSGSGMVAFIRQHNPDGSVVIQHEPGDGPPLLLDLSPTGKFLFAVTPKAATLWQSDGQQLWTDHFPGSRAMMVKAFADGRTLLCSADTALALDQRGSVYQRWRAPVPGQVAAGGPVDLAALAVAGGCAVLDAAGVGHGVATWEGPTELIALDVSGNWLAHAGGGRLSLLRLPPPPGS